MQKKMERQTESHIKLSYDATFLCLSEETETVKYEH